MDEIIEVIKEPKVSKSNSVENKPIEKKPEIKIVQEELTQFRSVEVQTSPCSSHEALKDRKYKKQIK